MQIRANHFVKMVHALRLDSQVSLLNCITGIWFCFFGDVSWSFHHSVSPSRCRVWWRPHETWGINWTRRLLNVLVLLQATVSGGCHRLTLEKKQNTQRKCNKTKINLFAYQWRKRFVKLLSRQEVSLLTF